MVEFTWELFGLVAVAQVVLTTLYVTYLTDRPEVPDILVSLLFVVVGAVVAVLWNPQWGTIVMVGGAVGNAI
ncbi:hypothetical protein [Halorubellus sp. PRR65]|uniref:hypothetical protein n=1 Tax=Halorubellus sp. PRR65 TaxID=3098148 RepID=UPI002B259138|nr:hypothetical protein [Halorubellus sp. PRR65]